jgi:hypothetical protein
VFYGAINLQVCLTSDCVVEVELICVVFAVWLQPSDFEIAGFFDDFPRGVIKYSRKAGDGTEYPINRGVLPIYLFLFASAFVIIFVVCAGELFSIKIGRMLGVANVYRPVYTKLSVCLLILGVLLAYFDIFSDITVLVGFGNNGDWVCSIVLLLILMIV